MKPDRIVIHEVEDRRDDFLIRNIDGHVEMNPTCAYMSSQPESFESLVV